MKKSEFVIFFVAAVVFSAAFGMLVWRNPNITGNAISTLEDCSSVEDLRDYWHFDNSVENLVGVDDASLKGGASYGDSILGNGVDLYSSSDYVKLGDDYFGGLGEFSIALWTKVGDLSKDGAFIEEGPWGPKASVLLWRDEVWSLGDEADTVSFLVSDSVQDYRLTSPAGSLNDTGWHHIVATFKSNDLEGLKIYLDGSLVATESTEGSGTISSSGSELLAGTSQDIGKQSLGGSLDEISIWNKALDSSEVSKLYFNGAGIEACQIGSAVDSGSGDGGSNVEESEDIDGSGSVDLVDLILVAQAFGDNDCASKENCGGADVNKDGNVNILDMIKVAIDILFNGEQDSAIGIRFIEPSSGSVILDHSLDILVNVGTDVDSSCDFYGQICNDQSCNEIRYKSCSSCGNSYSKVHSSYWDAVKGWSYSVSASCVDNFGNEESESVTFSVAGDISDDENPAVTINSPVSDLNSVDDNLFLDFGVNELSHCNYTISSDIGKVEKDISGFLNNYQEEIILQRGESYSLAVTCEDLVGNIGLSTANFMISSLGGSHSDLPLFNISQLSSLYVGGFKFKTGIFGSSRIGYTNGPIAYNKVNNTMFATGHATIGSGAIAEYKVPNLVKTNNYNSLPTAQVVQNFSRFLSRPEDTGNVQNIERIGGMLYVSEGPNGPELLVNTYEYYDASIDNTHTTLVVRDPANLAGSVVNGYYGFDARAHAARWMSPIPEEWQSALGGKYIVGSASGEPIISRWSVGPSAFVFDPYDIVGKEYSETTEPVSTRKLMDFTLSKGLHGEFPSGNDTLGGGGGESDLWTHLSGAKYGLIIPGTRTYIAFGGTGGQYYGVCYKCTDYQGTKHGGYAARNSTDRYIYYWAFDVNDFVDVLNGDNRSNGLRPYAHGNLSYPGEIPVDGLRTDHATIIGGTFDENTNTLYLSMKVSGSSEQSPAVLGFNLSRENFA